MRFIIQHTNKDGFYQSEHKRWTKYKRPMFYGFYDQWRTVLPKYGQWVLISLED